MTREHRKIIKHNEVINITEDKKPLVKRTVTIKKSAKIFESPQDNDELMTIEIKSTEPTDSLTSIISTPLLDDTASVRIINAPKGDWSEGETNAPELYNIITKLFPEFQDQYVISRQMQARGYHVKNDGAAILVDATEINNPNPDDIDFIVIKSKLRNDVNSELSEIVRTRQILDKHYPYSKQGHRMFTIGVIGDAGTYYGIRVQYIPMDDGFRLHRITNDPSTRKIKAMWNSSKKDPAYRRKNLDKLEFSIYDVYKETKK